MMLIKIWDKCMVKFLVSLTVKKYTLYFKNYITTL